MNLKSSTYAACHDPQVFERGATRCGQAAAIASLAFQLFVSKCHQKT